MKSLGDILRALRLHFGLTQEKIALLAKVERKHYQRLEYGECGSISSKILFRLAKPFNMKAGDLLNLAEDYFQSMSKKTLR